MYMYSFVEGATNETSNVKIRIETILKATYLDHFLFTLSDEEVLHLIKVRQYPGEDNIPNGALKNLPHKLQ